MFTGVDLLLENTKGSEKGVQMKKREKIKKKNITENGNENVKFLISEGKI
jgi:hypothetical protein